MSERVAPAAHRELEDVTMARGPARTRPPVPARTPGCAPPRSLPTKIAAKRDSIT
ncbi:hypothetical protein AB0425_05885 [Actinosynnema sp. NPDC051121]|nr:hypothetical protein [Saccharothrix sp.]